MSFRSPRRVIEPQRRLKMGSLTDEMCSQMLNPWEPFIRGELLFEGIARRLAHATMDENRFIRVVCVFRGLFLRVGKFGGFVIALLMARRSAMNRLATLLLWSGISISGRARSQRASFPSTQTGGLRLQQQILLSGYANHSPF